MGAAFNGFSIREYTNKMRSVDVFKCWPFTTSPRVTSQDLQSWLPPMSLPSSSSSPSPSPSYSNNNNNQLQSLRSQELSRTTDNQQITQQSPKSDESPPPSPSSSPSPSPSASPPATAAAPCAAEDERLEMVCPVCREFNAATLTAVNAHIDSCLAQTVRDERRHVRMMTTTTATTASTFKPPKPKAPKKRSIAEIFKVQQEVEEEAEEEEEEDDDDNDDDEEQQRQPQIERVLKLWKKDGGVDESVVDEVSITVTKFRWLSRRLEALRSGRKGGQSAKSDGGGASAATAAAEEDEDEEKSEMVCPVCRDFNAATVTAVNAHIDNCLAQAVRDERRQMRRTVGGGSKPKPKAPKKRSIAEILTMAPPIGATKSKAIEVEEKAAAEDNGDEDTSDYSASDSTGAAAAAVDVDATFVSAIKSKKSSTNKGKKTKKKKKKTKKGKKKSKVETLNSDKKTTVNKQMKKKKKKKKKKSFFNNEVRAKKEYACKRKVQSLVNSSRKLKGIGNKMVELLDIGPSIHDKKLGSKISLVEKKQKVKNFDPDGKQQKAVSPVHGVLKNHLKHFSGKASSGSSTQDGTDECSSDDELPTSDRYGRFAGKGHILGPKKRNSFDETMFNKPSDVLPTPLVKEQSSGSDEETTSFEANRNYDYTAINIDKRKDLCPIVESKQFTKSLEQATVQNFFKPCTNQEKSMHLEGKSETLTKVAFCDSNNSQPFDGGNSTTLHCSPYADISSPLSSVQEVKVSGTNSQLCESGSLSSIGKFIDHLEDPTFQVVPVNSNANDTRTFLEPSSSYSDSYNKATERPEFPRQTYGENDNTGQALGNREFSHLFAVDMIDNSFPQTGWVQGSVRNNSLDPNFFGLPLNSHGELISFSSSGSVGMNQLETSCTTQGSLSGLPVNNILHRGSHEYLSINERQVVQKISPKDGLHPFTHYPARLAATELPYGEREHICQPSSDMRSSPYVQPNSEMNIMRNSFIEQNQQDRVQNHKGNGMISLKESSDHFTLSSSQPTMRLMGKDVPIGRSSKAMQQFVGDGWADEESRRRHYSEYAVLENSSLGRCSKENWVSGSSLQISTDNVVQSAKIQSNQALPSTVLMSDPDTEFPQRLIDLQSNHVSHNGSLRVSRNASSYFHHPITQEPASCGVFIGAPDDFPERFIPGAKPVGLSSQSQVQATPCNFSQPTTSLSSGELNDRNKTPHVLKSAFEFPFLQTALSEQTKTSWFQRPYRSLPSWLSSSTDERLPVTFSQQFSGVSNQSFPQTTWGNKFTTPSVNHSAEVLYPSNPLTSLGPASIVQPLHVPVTSSTINSGCRNMNKVADSVKFDDMMAKDHHPCTNSRKRPAAVLDDSRKRTKLPYIEVQRNTRAVKLDPHVDSARSRCCQNEAQKLNTTSYPAVDSFKLDGTVTTGPVKLGPRAKHILRSS